MGAEEVRLMKGDVDNFPVGMRVLAVDDDPICLKLLDGLLRKCQYHVTTTNQAKVALNMLRENRERFDLVISDVHMPDMDGFKLLEQVGLEMDLPVIMLSANSDPRLVMQGVTHGACDYLVKPVRLEELRNIWQHVVRKKKVNPDHQKKTSDEDKFHQGHAEEGRDPSLTCYSDHNGKINKKRKDDDDGADENNDPDSDDPTSQKKPRVVWSIDLHRKFVTAVNQLGIEKAVPKRILDLMNVEGLTRENVASHLQKYRLYLKRISSNAAQQANLVAALGSKDAYMRMGSLDGFGTYQTLAGSGRLANTVMSPYNSSGMLGRLNSSTGISLQNLTSSGLIQPSHAQNFNGPMSNIGQFPSIVLSGSSNGNSIQRTPTNLSIDQLNQSKHDNCFGVFNPPDDQKVLVPSSSFKGSGAIGTINNSFSPSSNSIILQENCYPLTGGDIGNHSSLTRTSFLSDGFNVSRNGSSGFIDPGRSNQTLQNTSPLMNFQSSSSHLTDSLNQGHFPLSSVRENQSSAVPSLIHPLDISATTSISTPIENSRRDVNCEENFPDSVPNFNQLHSQSWGDNKQTYSNNSDVILRTLNSQLPASHGTQNLETNPNRQINISLAGRPNGGASTLLHQDEIGRLYTDPKVRSNGDYLLGQTKQHGGFTSHGYDSFDDLMSAVKPEHDGTAIGGGFALDVYSFGSCM